MAAGRHIDKICCMVLAFVIALTVIFVNAEQFGVTAMTSQPGYEQRLFDTSRVHTIDIIMDDWDSFLETCENEEYELCTLVIDNEAYKNTGIRAKGNTSLSMVSEYGNNRYSFKAEFDHYDNTKTYYGLDKLSLNNIIQDNTYMKDYLSYQMMNFAGASAPLCSYVYLTVNGEDWGLYLAVEGVEESFLDRNYGSDYGELYKPDSMDMGGGRGNGGGFHMNRFEENGADQNDADSSGNQDSAEKPGSSGTDANAEIPDHAPSSAGNDKPDSSGTDANTEIPDAQSSDSLKPPDSTDLPEGSERPGNAPFPDDSSFPEGMNPPDFPDFEEIQKSGSRSMRQGPGNAMGSSDVSLIYSDDEFDSYRNIFENAKTDITDSDKKRLIAALKSLNEGSDIENCVDTEAVIRYFVAHNFVCNFDSYTGSMIHNYYLYEKDGQMSMIPWDYNLAFGGFQSQTDAEGLVNYPIDSPVSGGETESRPMLAWIFNDDAYTESYHQHFSEFIAEYFESGYFSEMIDTVTQMIAPYVEKDPTKFCTYEEFQTGADTLKEFCLLRAQSIRGQLNGTIPSTADGQEADSSSLINADSVTIADMGSMGRGGRPGRTEKEKQTS